MGRKKKLPERARAGCWGCRYWRPISTAPKADLVCYYLLDTGRQRGCSAENCSRKEEMTREDKRWWETFWEDLFCAAGS